MAGESVDKTVAATLLEAAILGYKSATLTNQTTDAEPEIAAGSKVEIGGALFNFALDESISSGAAISTGDTAYIELVPASTSVTARWTTSAPTWSESKQAYYNAGNTNRIIGGATKNGAAVWNNKFLYDGRSQAFGESTDNLFMAVDISIGETLYTDDINSKSTDDGINIEVGYTDESTNNSKVSLKSKIIELGPWDMDGDPDITVGGGLTNDQQKAIRFAYCTIKNDADNAYYSLAEGGNIGQHNNFGAGVKLERDGGGTFDSVDFNSTSINRGWLFIQYVE